MTNNSETGHSNNVAIFEDLISICIGYGPAYNPANANINVPALQTKLAAANTALQNVKVAKTALDNSTNAREVFFQDLKKLSTRIVNALQATTATPQTVNDAKTVNRKLQGKRADNSFKKTGANTASPPIPGAEPEDKHISVSQQSFNGLIDNFTKLIQVISTEPAYNPNENELKTTELNTRLTEQKASNTAVINATTAYNNSRIIRNDILYKTDTGMVDLARNVKTYVKSLFGSTSDQYRQLTALKFTKPR